MLLIGKYKLEKADEMQFRLSEVQEGLTDKGNPKPDRFIGYYGYLDQAMSKIINSEALEATKDEDTIIESTELLNGLRGLYDSLKQDYNYRPKDEDGISSI